MGTTSDEPWWDRQLEYHSPLDRPAAGVMFDGTKATCRDNRRWKKGAKARDVPYQACHEAALAGDGVYDPARWPEARDLDLLAYAWASGTRWSRFMRNGARQDRAQAVTMRASAALWRLLRGSRRRRGRGRRRRR
jgi:hypothetical protein